MKGGNVRGGWNFFFKINKRDSTFIREMRVHALTEQFKPSNLRFFFIV